MLQQYSTYMERSKSFDYWCHILKELGFDGDRLLKQILEKGGYTTTWKKLKHHGVPSSLLSINQTQKQSMHLLNSKKLYPIILNDQHVMLPSQFCPILRVQCKLKYNNLDNKLIKYFLPLSIQIYRSGKIKLLFRKIIPFILIYYLHFYLYFKVDSQK